MYFVLRMGSALGQYSHTPLGSYSVCDLEQTI